MQIGNPQGMLYAIGALDERTAFQSFKKVVIHIVQPRLNHISTWETTPENLYEFAEYAKAQAELCMQPDAPRVPGEKQCRFCRGKADCPALAHHVEETMLAEFDSFETDGPLTPEAMTFEQLQTVLINKSMIEHWLKSVEAHVMTILETGGTFPGWKMVEGRSMRRWGDEDKAEKTLQKLLGDKAYSKKLLSVAQAEKALGKEKAKKIKPLIVKPDGKPVLVPEDDKRPPIKPKITAGEFDRIEDR